MNFFEMLYFVSLICGLLAELKLPPGSCVSKIVNGKLVQIGDCKKDDGSEIARLIQKSLDEKKKTQLKCGVTYNSKCYIAVVYDERNVTIKDAEAICTSMNIGKPANIYSLTHQKLLLSYIQPMMSKNEYRKVWTGMEFKNSLILLSSGETSTLPPKAWFPGHPSRQSEYVGVHVQNPDAIHQGLIDETLEDVLHGVICEI
ncbi:uncharacterized protein LOC144425759 [Styela clava]